MALCEFWDRHTITDVLDCGFCKVTFAPYRRLPSLNGQQYMSLRVYTNSAGRCRAKKTRGRLDVLRLCVFFVIISK